MHYMFEALSYSQSLPAFHHDYTPMQYTAIVHGCKSDNSQMKLFDFFLIFDRNIDCEF